MPAEFDIGPMVEKHSWIPTNRIRICRNFDEVQLANIRRGIVFVFAAWSGPSVMGLQRFTKVIQSLDTGALDVVVLDNDCLTGATAKELFGDGTFTTGGWGEAIWIREGKIVARELTHNASENSMIEHTKALVNGSDG